MLIVMILGLIVFSCSTLSLAYGIFVSFKQCELGRVASFFMLAISLIAIISCGVFIGVRLARTGEPSRRGAYTSLAPMVLYSVDPNTKEVRL